VSKYPEGRATDSERSATTEQGHESKSPVFKCKIEPGIGRLGVVYCRLWTYRLPFQRDAGDTREVKGEANRMSAQSCRSSRESSYAMAS
jgi:hypothetical protein